MRASWMRRGNQYTYIYIMINKTPDTLIFDLDGTLLDSLADLAAATNHTLSRFGLPQRTLPEVRQMVGNGVRRLMLRAVHEPASPDGGLAWIEHPVCALPDGTLHPEFEAMMAEFRTYYDAHCRDASRLYDGIAAMLDRLLAMGFKLAVVSNKPQGAVTILQQDYFCRWFKVAVGEREGVARKPDPALLHVAMKQLGSTPADTVYVGDSDVDILTARNAGIPCISVLWGFRDEAFLKAHGATCFAHTPADIVEMMRQHRP